MIEFDKLQTNELKIFNNGIAGECPIKSLEVERGEPGNNRPAYYLVMTDKEGAVLREGIFLINEDSPKKDLAIAITGERFKHIITVLDKEATKGLQFEDSREMIHKCMDLIKTLAHNRTDLIVVVTYGTANYANPKGYLKLRRLVPFMRTETDPKIFLSGRDLIHRPTPTDLEKRADNNNKPEDKSDKENDLPF